MTILWPDERETVAPPRDISTEDWGRQNRELSALTSAHAGPWSLDMIPFFRPVLQALDTDEIEIVCIQKATQIAGSETVLTWLGKVAAEDPGPAMIVFADEDTATEFCKRRIHPMFLNSPILSRLIIPAELGQSSIILRNGFSLTMAWASSIAKTASRPIRYLILDEICKPAYEQVQAEGSVISRIINRTETFPNRKIVMLSSVTMEGDNMDKQMALCHAVFDWHVPCHACGEFQPMTFFPVDKNSTKGRVSFDKEGGPQARAKTAVYRCRSCGEAWTTAQKNEAVSRGTPQARAEHGKIKRAGFHVSRLLSLFPGGRLESLAEAFLLANDDLSELQSFYNNSLALHWKTYKVTTSVEELMKAKGVLPSLLVPDIADCIIVTIDMQQNGFWYVARAWASKLKESWLIECGQLADWEDVDEIIFEKLWRKEDGTALGCWRAALDIGGTKEEGKLISRTEEAQEWWIRNRIRAKRKVFLCKGSSRTLPTKLTIGKILETTPSGKKIGGAGLQIIELNTQQLKDLFFHALDKACKHEASGAHLPSDIADAYFRHITAEAKENDGSYKRLSRDNHWLDCEMMQQGMISGELFGGLEVVRRMAHAPATAPTPQTPPPQPKKPQENPFLAGRGNPFTGGRL